MTQDRRLRNLTISLGRPSVGSPHNNSIGARAERRAMIALVAVFALLVQVLIPGLAAAAPSARDPGMVICTGHGVAPTPTGDTAPAKELTGGACGHCVCPPAAAGLTPQIATAFLYARIAIQARHTTTSADRRPPARAPPRPLGQGPPLSHA